MSFEFKPPRTHCEEGSFHPGSNRDSGRYGSGCGDGGGGGGVLSRYLQYSNDRYYLQYDNHDIRNDDARRGRCISSHNERDSSPNRDFALHDVSYEDFLAWKEYHNCSLCRGFTNANQPEDV